MNKYFLSALATLLLLVLVYPVSGVAQSTNRKIPTAPEATLKTKGKSKKGVMRGTTQYDRWQAAIKSADSRASQIRSKGVK